VHPILSFDEAHGLSADELRERYGGKAASLMVMATDLGLPVPPGFAIPTDVCRAYLAGGWPDGLDAAIASHVARLESVTGRRFGDPADPLLVSVRSGAAVSMPGMMDTILNLGLNDATTAGLAAGAGDAAFAAACRERFETSFRDIVGVDEVPSDPWAQLRAAIEAVFRSWEGERARAYRAREGISDDLGTAVTVQAMVFGNRGADSGTGVLFTRDPASGAATMYGDVLFGAQGDDVVAGTHQTEPIATLDTRMPAVGAELRRHADVLEHHFADCCDIEFTIEEGRLWMLQVRVGKRSPQAALRMAVQMAEDDDFPLSRADAVRRVAAILADPPTDASRVVDGQPVVSGVPASPGVASGEIAIDCEAAIEAAAAGRQVVLVRPSTSPDDVTGMARSVGILTSTGGPASHAAVVARGWGIPAVVGAADVRIEGDVVHLGDTAVRVGDTITLDGTSGGVFLGALADRQDAMPEVATLLAWARELDIPIPAAPDAERPAANPADGASPAPIGPGDVSAASAASVGRDDLLHAVRIKGYATEDALADQFGVPADDLGPALAELQDDGLLESAAGSLRMTGAGREAADARLAQDAATWGHERAEAALDRFLDLDQRMKETVTAWQLRDVHGEQVLNDHTDVAYDAAVIERLRDLCQDASAWLQPLVGELPRLASYGWRLDRALAEVTGGDQRFVASPRVDSCHTVWFELHEDLILLAGRRREDEVAAGRA
jgi:pyruvate,orthophosphate dikinase